MPRFNRARRRLTPVDWRRLARTHVRACVHACMCVRECVHACMRACWHIHIAGVAGQAVVDIPTVACVGRTCAWLFTNTNRQHARTRARMHTHLCARTYKKKAAHIKRKQVCPGGSCDSVGSKDVPDRKIFVIAH